MEFLVLFGVVVVVLLCIGFFWVVITSGTDAKKRERLDAEADSSLAGMFDGSPQVIYAPRDRSGGVTTPALVRVAGQHGYVLHSETGQMATRQVIFTRSRQDRVAEK